MPHHDLIVIGAGPGGYVAAIRAAQLGKNVACVDREPQLGGTCLRIGCIPSKALLESSHLYEVAREDMATRGIVAKSVSLDLSKMQRHKAGVVKQLTGGVASLFKKNKVTAYTGSARFLEPNKVAVDNEDDTQEITADAVIIATGSSPASLPGIEIDGTYVWSSTEALDCDEVPEHLVVIGAGYIGLELGTVWRRLGAKVTVLEYLDRILPGMDSEIAAAAKKIFDSQGLEFHLQSKVTGVKTGKKGCSVQVEDADPIDCDRILMAVGRRPHTDGLDLENIKLPTTDRGFLNVDSRYQTVVPNVYAIGDVIGGAMLAHKAEEEGIACVERLYTGYGHVNYSVIPGVVYTEPEIATVGATEEKLKEDGIAYNKGTFPYIANGRAKASNTTQGFVKVLADKETDRLLGIHILGPHAGELVAEAAVALEFGASSEDLARTCHAHPTLAEATKEAALAVDKRAIHY